MREHFSVLIVYLWEKKLSGSHDCGLWIWCEHNKNEWIAMNLKYENKLVQFSFGLVKEHSENQYTHTSFVSSV